MAFARLSMASTAAKGEVLPLRLVIQHPMETGFRVGADGRAFARNVIRLVTCRYAGADVFRAELGSGVSANPYFEFFLRAETSGDVVCAWQDDAGEKGSVSATLVVR
jgi:sulfur-oxidizing protein SoxZ